MRPSGPSKSPCAELVSDDKVSSMQGQRDTSSVEGIHSVLTPCLVLVNSGASAYQQRPLLDKVLHHATKLAADFDYTYVDDEGEDSDRGDGDDGRGDDGRVGDRECGSQSGGAS